jgi:ganglioside GM2 activator
MEAKVAGFWIKVPCVDNFGSCNYGNLCSQWPGTCQKYFEKYGIPCTCPIPANTYTISDFSDDITQKIPVSLKGDIRLTANLVSAAAGHQVCLQLEIKIKS